LPTLLCPLSLLNLAPFPSVLALLFLMCLPLSIPSSGGGSGFSCCCFGELLEQFGKHAMGMIDVQK